jgi:hypothetical protein
MADLYTYFIQCKNISNCGTFTTRTAYIDDDKPTVCPTCGEATIVVTPNEEFINYTQVPQKGIQYLKQFQNMHTNKNSECNFQPIIITPPVGYSLELTEVHTVWHEDLELNSSIAWELQVLNPLYDPVQPKVFPNLEYLAVQQFYYKDFSELWAGSHKRPISDGPTRQMSHIFTDRNSKDNREPFVLKQGMRVYAYATQDARRAEGVGVHLIDGVVYYEPYTEATLTSGKYDPTISAKYPAGYDYSTLRQTDDCYTLNAIGALFIEVTA